MVGMEMEDGGDAHLNRGGGQASESCGPSDGARGSH